MTTEEERVQSADASTLWTSGQELRQGGTMQRPAVLPTGLFPQPDFIATRTTRCGIAHTELATPMSIKKVHHRLTDKLL